ncbi:MAG: universal stress protein [Thermodesulfobacteriota bacterium]
MVKYDKILFPVDLTEISNFIAPYVTEMADRLGAEIHILFVARSLSFYRDILVPTASISDFEEEVSKGGETALKKFVGNCFADRQVKVELLRGEPAEAIVEYARKAEIDLIMMGTHGRKGLDRVWFGSVADVVVKTSPVPVITINPYRVKQSGRRPAGGGAAGGAPGRFHRGPVAAPFKPGRPIKKGRPSGPAWSFHLGGGNRIRTGE